ncbi:MULTISPECIES: metal-dependent transcriptional regulator [unclassified Frondihabitans]|uniref:metal-dependent transcriptional regulator n=1 Tax=unclassified Frondihabitans TaxID=2626248 RepID=UPI000F4E18CB|nr:MULTISPECIES: metal-dependent transcriptional regulator [unclassified Frondihabitans]RPE74333.1 DtxR family iron (metal) dependent repressor [Frondihabitans sp. PhB153]RPF02762.1 DtxR family iron (metal) dependent repressor [Frondihabitans sp. PhB161]
MDTDSISSVAQDYVKAIWAATEWGDPPITAKGLAERFGTTPANVTDTMRRLATQGLVDYEPYRPVSLTPRGTSFALDMVRRHRLIETFLVTSLGYGWSEVHDEAERLEHAVSTTLIDRIDDFLGRPVADPHGDPIPSREGATAVPGGALRLAVAPPGDYRVVRVSDADPQELVRAEEFGLVPGAVVRAGADAGAGVGDVWVVPVAPAAAGPAA